MRPSDTVFFLMLFLTELFIAITFSFIFDKETFYQLFIISAVGAFIMGFTGLLKMQKQHDYPYIDAVTHEWH